MMVETRSQASRSNQQQPTVQRGNEGNDAGDSEEEAPARERSQPPSDAPPPPPPPPPRPDTIWSQLLGILKECWDWFVYTPTCKILAVGLVVLILAILGAWVLGRTKSTSWEYDLVSFEERYRTVIARFPSQSEDTKTSLYIAMKHILDTKEPRDPSSIIVLIPPALVSSSFPSCFIQVVGGMLNLAVHPRSPVQVKLVNESTFSERDMGRIHSELVNYFHSGGTSVMVSQIQNFQAEEHLELFHTFCDSTHAPVKRAAYFFLIPIPLPLYNPNGWGEEEVTSLGNEILENSWASVLAWDKIHPLLARIGSWGTIQLNQGDSCKPEWAEI